MAVLGLVSAYWNPMKGKDRESYLVSVILQTGLYSSTMPGIMLFSTENNAFPYVCLCSKMLNLTGQIYSIGRIRIVHLNFSPSLENKVKLC